jgi:hypothetical protein
MIGALAAAVIALVASAAIAAGTLGSPLPGPSTTRGDGQGSYAAMMGGQGQDSYRGMMSGSMMGSTGMVWLPGDGVAVSSIRAARARTASAARAAGLHPGEVMWFGNGFYVELKDSAGKPATEVIVDPRTGTVSTEPGPAMMWNASLGMMHLSGGGAGSVSGGGAGSVDSTKARSIATSWLAANRPGTTIRSIDTYPGYLTLDLQHNGVVSGMMSVNSSTEAAWYHTWHGAFIATEDS